MITLDDAASLPDQPGVYFFNNGATPVYIGKSVNLRARVKSHIAQAKLSKKERAIITSADNLTYHTTLNNFDALILEARLIQAHKPQYNVVWKDDKHFLYIKITMGDEFPKIFPVRREPEDGTSLYFGPFKSTLMTEKLIYELRRIIPFCTQPALGRRQCFYSRLGYCDPCPNIINRTTDPDLRAALSAQYRRNIRKVIRILSGRTAPFLRQLEKQLQELSHAQRYEEAIQIRGKLLQFSLFLDRRSFGEHSKGVDVDMNRLDKEFYAFMDELGQNVAGSYRIECFDMSNLFGKQPTGSMVVFEDGLFMKKEYRKFAVKSGARSDIHMMEEVIRRRLQHTEWRTPTLIILDGGKPQLRHIHSVLRSLNYHIPLISIAKRPDRILTVDNGYRPVHIDTHSLLFKLFQSLRDESHRFAKKYHVSLRNRNALN